MKRILIVAQDTALRAAITRILQPAGYAVELAAGEKRARELSRDGRIDAAIVAPGSFGASGLTLARDLHSATGRVIVLADRAGEIGALARSLPGAGAFISQPLDEDRLLRCLAKAMAPPPNAGDQPGAAPEVLRFEGRILDLAGHTFLDADGREVPLTRAEFTLLAAFARSPGRVLSRDHLHNAVARRGSEPYDRSIDMLVARVRRKIEPDPKAPRFILTVPGEGYKFAARPSADTAAEAPHVDHARVGPRFAERRQLTVLACQILGFAAISARLDPEDLSAVIASIHQTCAAVVAQLHGMVVDVPLGDSLLVYFGYPQAQEDDAERAVRAGLELIRLVPDLDIPLPAKLHLRIGVSSGLMLVGEQRGHGATGPRAAGEALNVALHLRSVAAPDSVVIAASTHDLIGAFFNYQELEPVVLEDDSAPIPVWRVIGDSATAGRFEALHRTGMPELVDREEPMELLLRRWSKARSGAGQVVVLTGEAGIGKSRLAIEFEQRIAVQPNAVLRYFGSPLQTDASLFVLIDELQRAAGLVRFDTPAGRLAKLEALLAEIGPRAREGAAFLADLLSLPTEERQRIAQLTPQKRKERTFAALQARIEEVAARQPVLVVVEDAQWIDPSSLEFLALLVERAPGFPVLMLVIARSEFAPSWPDDSHVSPVALSRLGRDDTESLVAGVARGKPLPEEVTSQILARTDGVPLFVEELTKTVLESGVVRENEGRYGMIGAHLPQEIPKTLHSSLLSRLDRLGPGKEIAQIGAVIGREFPYELLCMVVAIPEPALRAGLDRLVASELVFRRGVPPLATYAFKHALVRDAAYVLFVRARRQELHAAVAKALEERFPDVVEAQPELLAHHHQEAGNIAKAVGYLLTAGERALSRSALTEALAQLTQALDLLSGLPEDDARRRQELNLQVALGRALMAREGYTAPVVRETYRRARVLCEELNEKNLLPLVLFGHSLNAWFGADYETALEQAQELCLWGEREKERAGKAVGLFLMGMTLPMTGRFGAARQHLQQALEIDRFELPGRQPFLASAPDVRITSLMYLHTCLFLLGWPDQAKAAARRALAESPTQLYSLAAAQVNACRMHALERDPEKTAIVAATALRLSEEQGYPFFVGAALVYRGWALAQGGQATDGIEFCRSGIIQLRALGAINWLPRYLALLTECHEKAGDAVSALRELGEAFRAMEETGEGSWEAELHRLKGRLLLRTGVAPEQAESCFARAMAVAGGQEARLLELRAATSLAGLFSERGRRAEARDVLAPIYAWFTEGFDCVDLQEAKMVLDTLR